MKKPALHWQILIAIVLAALAGSLSGTEAGIGALRLHAVYEFLGTIFIKALKMIIVPLIFSSIVVGITGIGRAEERKDDERDGQQRDDSGLHEHPP